MESNNGFIRFYFGVCAAMAIVIMFELLGTIRKINRKLDNDFKRDTVIHHLPQNVKLDSFVKPKQNESSRATTTN